MDWALLRALRWLLLALALSVFSGCVSSKSGSDGSNAGGGIPVAALASPVTLDPSITDPPPASSSVPATDVTSLSDNVVCNPLENGNNANRLDAEHGLKGELWYLDPSKPRYTSVLDYIANGLHVDATLFFDQVNVPTRAFERGFFTQDGSLVETPTGEKLYEWFAIAMDSVIRLQSTDRPGRYQFAVISDDGAIFNVDTGSGMRTLINNDGLASSRMACATEPLTINFNTDLSVHLKYYQGPRTHIALVLLWREFPDDPAEVMDPECGKSGNDYFFNSKVVPSAPMAAYNGLLARGWRPVPAVNFYLPAEAPANPCTPGETGGGGGGGGSTTTPPALPDFEIVGFDGTTDSDSLFAIWQTPNVAANSVLYYGTDPNQLNASVTMDAMNMVHQVSVEGMAPATKYYLQAVSIDANGRIRRSAMISKTTK